MKTEKGFGTTLSQAKDTSIAGSPQKLEERRILPLTFQREHSPADILILDF